MHYKGVTRAGEDAKSPGFYWPSPAAFFLATRPDFAPAPGVNTQVTVSQQLAWKKKMLMKKERKRKKEMG